MPESVLPDEKFTFVKLSSIKTLGIKDMVLIFCEIQGYSDKAFISLLKSSTSQAYKFNGLVILSNLRPKLVFMLGLSWSPKSDFKSTLAVMSTINSLNNTRSVLKYRLVLVFKISSLFFNSQILLSYFERVKCCLSMLNLGNCSKTFACE